MPQQKKTSHSVKQIYQRSIQEYECIKLSERDRQAFVKALLDPGAPNKALRSAAAWYKKKISQW
jgi:uncharacterized protein (DUF1778 family)